MESLRIGIFGVTGAVGTEILKVIENRRFPAASIRVFASERSAGTVINGIHGALTVENAAEADFHDLDLAFFAAGSDFSEENARIATNAECVVIDNSSVFRNCPDVPLIIPEINPESAGNSLLYANPNCTTAIVAVPLHVLHRSAGLKKVIISTYQAASGAGSEGMSELLKGTEEYLKTGKAHSSVFPYPLAFNLFPHIDSFETDGYTKEEHKVVNELRKILSVPDLRISCTSVRVPLFRVHSEAVTVETDRKITAEMFCKLLQNTSGIEVRDNPSELIYPMPLTATGKYAVETGRIRQSNVFGENGLDFFVSGDQLLKGAALNAVQIAELLLSKKCFRGK